MRPPGLVAHKHYQLCVVAQAMSRFLFDPEATLTSVGSEHNCCRKTVKRWVCWTASIAEPAVVMQKVVQAVDSPVIPRHSLVSQLCCKAVNAIGREVVQRTAEVLAALECLCSAWQLEPPGLGAVFQHVVGDRSGIGTYARASIPELVQGAG